MTRWDKLMIFVRLVVGNIGRRLVEWSEKSKIEGIPIEVAIRNRYFNR